MAEENKPEYHSSRAEEYLNYLVDSSDSYPQDKPQSRAEEYLQYLCAHKGEGGGGAEPLIVYTEGTMQTSTLPAIVVPRLTKDQLDNIHTAMSQGKLVLISDGNGHYTVTEIDETYDGVRFVYANAYVDYYLEGDNVVCAHTLLEGSKKLYLHNIYAYDSSILGGVKIYFSVITDSNTPIATKNDLINLLYKINLGGVGDQTHAYTANGLISSKRIVTGVYYSGTNKIGVAYWDSVDSSSNYLSYNGNISPSTVSDLVKEI